MNTTKLNTFSESALIKYEIIKDNCFNNILAEFIDEYNLENNNDHIKNIMKSVTIHYKSQATAFEDNVKNSLTTNNISQLTNMTNTKDDFEYFIHILSSILAVITYYKQFNNSTNKKSIDNLIVLLQEEISNDAFKETLILNEKYLSATQQTNTNSLKNTTNEPQNSQHFSYVYPTMIATFIGCISVASYVYLKKNK